MSLLLKDDFVYSKEDNKQTQEIAMLIYCDNLIYMWFALYDLEVKVKHKKASQLNKFMSLIYFMYGGGWLSLSRPQKSLCCFHMRFTQPGFMFYHVEMLPEEVWNCKLSMSRRKLNDAYFLKRQCMKKLEREVRKNIDKDRKDKVNY